MTRKPSKFAGLLRSRQDADPAPAGGTTADSTAKAGRGRPGGQGKRLNPEYAQVTAYIPKALHAETKINLIRDGNREFSELVAELLAAWNQHQSDKR